MTSMAPEQMFLDKAALMGLTTPQWVALTGGLRVLGRNHDGSASGVFTHRAGQLTTDFFRAVTSMDYEWSKNDEVGISFTLTDRKTRRPEYRATRNDLLFGSTQQLRAVAEVYAGRDGQSRFVRDFIAGWDTVMMADRYDVKAGSPQCGSHDLRGRRISQQIH